MFNQFGPISLWSVIPCYWYSSMQVEAVDPITTNKHGSSVDSNMVESGTLQWFHKFFGYLCDHSKCAAGDCRRRLRPAYWDSFNLRYL